MAKKMMEDLVFNQMLCSNGYKVDYAVGTTYSLDLTSFISLPFSLGFIEEPDEAMKNSTSYLFTALRICTGKLAVFCNFSNIKVPDGNKKLFYSLIEKSIFAVDPTGKSKNKNSLINFHPKVWVIQESEQNGNRSRIKVIVMSRNLSSDNSLDAICELTGDIDTDEASQESITKHKPLCDFLSYLKKHADKQKRSMIDRLISSIKHVKSFDLSDSPFDDYSFIPMGIKDYSATGKDLLEKLYQSNESIVISPFIDKHVLNGFSKAQAKTLITREMSLSNEIVESLGKENIYIVNQHMLDNEESSTVDLHAKIYYSRDKDGRQHMYLGSTNATQNGFERNVEFLLGLRFAPYQCSYEKFRENFISDDNECKFEPMIGILEPSGEKLKDYQETLILRHNILSIRKANVILQDNGRYTVLITTEDGLNDNAYIYPLMRPDMKRELADDLTFKDLELEELSEFYVIEVGEARQLIKVSTDIIPEDRDEAICRRMINKSQFMDCISFILADNKKVYVAEKMLNDTYIKVQYAGNAARHDFPALYEDLLKIAYERPDVFKDMDSFMNSLPEDIIPDDFNRLYKEIQHALKNYRR